MSKISKALGVLNAGGPRAVAQRAARYAYKRLGAAILDEELLDSDVADSRNLVLQTPTDRPNRARKLKIGWITAPPRAGSGGHTTLFRMVEAMEQAGHTCELFLYDRYGGDIAEQEQVIRSWWPSLRARVRDARNGIAGVDAAVASSWDMAHVLATHGSAPMRRLYFIQDFEPFFYARGSMYALAEDSYRFGFRNIALGQMVAKLLESEVGVTPDVTEFGCDTSVYRVDLGAVRTGVVVHARPDVPRRGFWLARLALAEFHKRYPDVPIHLYGAEVTDLSFPAVQHGRLTPEQLSELYNTAIAGIAMSFTNISLVAEEMLASGVIPVVNESAFARADLDNDNVAWAVPTPLGIAEALGRLVESVDDTARPARAAASVRQFGWSKAQQDVLRIVEEEVYGA